MNFRKWLSENSQEGTRELYHATLSGPGNEILNGFIQNGIDPERAKGHHQGSGFFLYRDKQQALGHARNLDDTQDKRDPFFIKQEIIKGNPIIVVVDEPVTPECFDIDYEVFAQAFARFMYDNHDFFEKNAHALNLFIFSKDDQRRGINASFDSERVPPNLLDSKVIFKSRSNLDNPYPLSPEMGGQASQFAKRLANLSPEMFNKFESEYLPMSPAVKYNCKKRIWPLRIEDIDGNTLWHRTP